MPFVSSTISSIKYGILSPLSGVLAGKCVEYPISLLSNLITKYPLSASFLQKKSGQKVAGDIAPETNIIDLCGGYLYLLELAKEHGLFESDDPFNLFEKETLH